MTYYMERGGGWGGQRDYASKGKISAWWKENKNKHISRDFKISGNGVVPVVPVVPVLLTKNSQTELLDSLIKTFFPDIQTNQPTDDEIEILKKSIDKPESKMQTSPVERMLFTNSANP